MTHPNDADGAVLASLEAQGVNLSEPMLIEFAIDAPNKEAAAAIEAVLIRQDYEAEVEFDPGEPAEPGERADGGDPHDNEFGPSWTIYVSIRMVPEYDEIVRIQEELGRLSAPYEGTPDGWGTLIES